MNQQDVLTGWAAYVKELSSCADACNRAEERQLYTRHLAAAATIGAQLVTKNHAAASQIVASERRAFGWSYLSGSAGDRAEKAFTEFAQRIGAAEMGSG